MMFSYHKKAANQPWVPLIHKNRMAFSVGHVLTSASAGVNVRWLQE